jgi:hypothetical protein
MRRKFLFGCFIKSLYKNHTSLMTKANCLSSSACAILMKLRRLAFNYLKIHAL